MKENKLILFIKFFLILSVSTSSGCSISDTVTMSEPSTVVTSSNNLSAVKIVKTIKHEEVMEKNQSFDETLERAVQRAKDKALAEAGVIERQQSYFYTTISEHDGETNSRVYYKTYSELDGNILSVEHLKKPTTKEKKDVWYVIIKVKVTIVKYQTKKDPTFVSDFDGIKTVYRDSSCIRFKISPNKDCYLVFFWLSDDETQILYPIPEEEIRDDRLHNRLFTKNKQVPINWIYTALKGKPHEEGSLICVMTKEYIPFPFHEREKVNGFSTQTTREAFLEWLSPIERDQKNLDEFHITIVPNN